MSPEPFVSRAKAPPAKRSEKGYGDENVFASEHTLDIDWKMTTISPIELLTLLFGTQKSQEYGLQFTDQLSNEYEIVTPKKRYLDTFSVMFGSQSLSNTKGLE